ncbi:MAG: thiamine phosphate synthase [Candidatus Krumholzibacteria bacterium]|nr:thiamine phosphate synthase [Candidatus Krumholzibacteria bacterium]
MGLERNGSIDSEVISRIIDANSNRCAEGLRVIEEIARFSEENDGLFKEIKDIRHVVREVSEKAVAGSHKYRDTGSDVGAAYTSGSESRRSSFHDLCRANFLRAEEALRVLEEFGKLIDPGVSGVYKSLRFRVYAVEKSFMGRVVRTCPMPTSPFLYGFIDRIFVDHGESGGIAELLVDGGVDMIQYRAKDVDRVEMLKDIAAILSVTKKAGVPLIINDYPDLARDAGADGVHIGAGDVDPATAREIIGEDAILGLTVHSLEDLTKVDAGRVDYVGVGAVYSTDTKPSARAVGTELVRSISAATRLPVVAIGGLEAGNVGEVFAAGAAAVAVVSAILRGDIRKNCFTFRQIIDKCK